MIDAATPYGLSRDITIPKVLMEEFRKAPRVKMVFGPEGYWPIGPEILKDSGFFQRLFADPEFAKTHEVVIMKKM